MKLRKRQSFSLEEECEKELVDYELDVSEKKKAMDEAVKRKFKVKRVNGWYEVNAVQLEANVSSNNSLSTAIR